MCGPKFCSMKITQDLRAEVQAMGENERKALEALADDQAAAQIAIQQQGMAAKSKEFLDKGGSIYLPAAE